MNKKASEKPGIRRFFVTGFQSSLLAIILLISFHNLLFSMAEKQSF